MGVLGTHALPFVPAIDIEITARHRQSWSPHPESGFPSLGGSGEEGSEEGDGESWEHALESFGNL